MDITSPEETDIICNTTYTTHYFKKVISILYLVPDTTFFFGKAGSYLEC